MKKLKSSLVIMTILISSFNSICMSANASSSEDIANIGTNLLRSLLERQYESFIDGSECLTSDIMTDSKSNDFYKLFLKWYSSSSAMLGESWTDYDYNLELNKVDGYNLHFSNNVEYWVKDCVFKWSNSNISYDITIGKQGENFFITDITTTAGDFNDFKDLLNYKKNENGNLAKSVASDDIYVNDLIEDAKKLKISIENNRTNEKDVVNMEQQHQEYLRNGDSISPLSTAYSYVGERGRAYADIYATSPNPCFYSAGSDCTNFVSQCIWAAYGGWTSGDSESTMATNIRNKKRMQSSSSMSNWFAGSGGGGTPWESVTGLWNFLNTTNSTGPRATKHNNNSIYTNIYPGDILTGQVLQVRRGSTGDYGHSVYVAGGINDSYNNIKVAQHTDNRIRSLSNLINAWGGDNCYMRQLKFQTAYFNK